MIKILDCSNLLGDSIYLLQPVRQFINRDICNVILVASPGLCYEMFVATFKHIFGIGIYDDVSKAIETVKNHDFEIVRLQAGLSGTICFESARLQKKQLHISEGYAKMLGFDFEGSLRPYTPWAEKYFTTTKPFIGIAPFSRSCSRHSGQRPNKTLDDWKWNHLVSYLRHQKLPLVIFSGPDDRLNQVAVSEEEYYTARNFDALCKALSSLKLFVTVDNGLGHLASCLDVPTIILWPIVSCVEFIAPLWAPKTRYIQLEPNSASPAAILSGLRPYTRDLFNEPIEAEESSTTS